MASRSRRSSRKKKKLNKRLKLSIFRYGTVFSAVLLVIILVVLITGGFKDPVDETVMDNEYVPSDTVKKSLDSNEETEAIINGGSQSVENIEAEINIEQEAESDTDQTKDEDIAANSEEQVLDEDDNPDVLKDDNNSESGSGNQLTSQAEEPAIIEESSQEEQEGLVDNSAENPSDDDKNSTEDVNTETMVNGADASEGPGSDSMEPVEENISGESDKENYIKDEWLDEVIQDNRSEINDQDLVIGANIYNQLDTVYLFGLAEGGLTDEEREEAMQYLEGILTDEEIEKAMELVEKYIGLMN